jgi:undecaprenyl-diphosphatase
MTQPGDTSAPAHRTGPPPSPPLVPASAVCAAAFALLAGLVSAGNPRLTDLDFRWQHRAYAFTLGHDWCASLAHGATWLGSGAGVAVVTTAAALRCLVGRRAGLAGWLVATVAGSALVNAVAKAGLGRVRPSSAGALTSAQGLAFPSGHTQAATVTYVAVVLVVGWRAGWVPERLRPASVVVVTAVVAAVGLSRILLGAHWPSDVLGGWLLGSAWVTAATAVLVRARRASHSSS